MSPPQKQSRDLKGADKSDRAVPVAYLITFTSYGTWLHGRKEGSVDRRHNLFGEPGLPGNDRLLEERKRSLKQRRYLMDKARRATVLSAILALCRKRDWLLLAAHVRSNHIHLVLQCTQAPESIMTAIKASASRALNEAGFDTPDRRRWTRHGSTRYLWTPEQSETAIRYVIYEQGDPMAVYDGTAP